MNGEHHFNEVHLNEVFIPPDNRVLGEIGSGWTGVTSELAYERSGPERYLSTSRVRRAAGSARAERASVDSRLGATAGRLFGLHQMSRAVAGAWSAMSRPMWPPRW